MIDGAGLTADHAAILKEVVKLPHNCFDTVANILDHDGGSLRHIVEGAKLADYCKMFLEHLLSGCDATTNADAVACLKRGDVARAISNMIRSIHKENADQTAFQFDDDGVAKGYAAFESFYVEQYRVGQPVDNDCMPCRKACSFLMESITVAQKGQHVKFVRPELHTFRSEFAARSKRKALATQAAQHAMQKLLGSDMADDSGYGCNEDTLLDCFEMFARALCIASCFLLKKDAYESFTRTVVDVRVQKSEAPVEYVYPFGTTFMEERIRGMLKRLKRSSAADILGVFDRLCDQLRHELARGLMMNGAVDNAVTTIERYVADASKELASPKGIIAPTTPTTAPKAVICAAFNRGQCAEMGKCPNGDTHKCTVCMKGGHGAWACPGTPEGKRLIRQKAEEKRMASRGGSSRRDDRDNRDRDWRNSNSNSNHYSNSNSNWRG